MRALIQRVKKASVSMDGNVLTSIGSGILILLGVKQGDEQVDAVAVAEKCASLRIFEDSSGKMNLSVRDTAGEALVISQFTLYGDTRRGNRPSYSDAAPPEFAEPLYEHFLATMRGMLGAQKVHAGVFRAMMDVELVNEGPVTLLVESKPKQ
jgi:D-tyrosyl-tRNA(Tyr) deacylase